MAQAKLPPLGKLSSQTVNEPTENREKKEKVTRGEAKLLKKGLGEKFAETFITDDIDSVKRHVVKEVIIPAILGAILDAVNDGLSMIFKMDTRTKTGSSYTNGGYYQYASKSSLNYKSNSGNNRRDDTVNSNPRADYSRIAYATKEDANDVLSSLQDLADPDQYGQASLADLYDIAGISVTGQSFTDNRYGWTFDMLAHVKCHRIREGWVLDLPKPIVLD